MSRLECEDNCNICFIWVDSNFEKLLWVQRLWTTTQLYRLSSSNKCIDECRHWIANYGALLEVCAE